MIADDMVVKEVFAATCTSEDDPAGDRLREHFSCSGEHLKHLQYESLL